MVESQQALQIIKVKSGDFRRVKVTNYCIRISHASCRHNALVIKACHYSSFALTTAQLPLWHDLAKRHRFYLSLRDPLNWQELQCTFVPFVTSRILTICDQSLG